MVTAASGFQEIDFDSGYAKNIVIFILSSLRFKNLPLPPEH